MNLNFFCRHFFVKLSHFNNELSEQIIVITDSNIELDLETARYFTRCNAIKIILTARSIEKKEEVKKSIKESMKLNEMIEVWQLDLESYESCQAIHHRRRKVWLDWMLSWRMLKLSNSISRSWRAVRLSLWWTSLISTLFKIIKVSVLLLFIVRVKENLIA